MACLLFITRKIFTLIVLLAGLGSIGASPVFAAQEMGPNTRVEAQSRGYIFETSHDDIVAKAKREQGAMQAHISQGPETIRAVVEAFKAEYPFVNAQVKEMTGTDEAQRFILQVKAGRAQDFDAGHISDELFKDYLPYLKKFDIWSMAQKGVLRIPTEIIDPVNRNYRCR